MLVYRLTVVPIIEPGRTERSLSVLPTADPVVIDAWWQNRFASDAWQNSKPTVLGTQMVTLLCKDWKPVSNNSLQLSKLTMLVPYAKLSKSHRESASLANLNKDAESMVIIDASEGAIIQFKEAPNWFSGNMPPIVGGRLVGAIRIYNSPGRDTAEKLWELKTREVRIERRRFWTTEAIELNYDDGSIRGRDLSIYLKRDLLSPNQPQPAQQSQWGMFDHMDLIYVDQVRQKLPAGGLWSSMSLGAKNETGPELAKLPASLELFCGGRFRFDFNRAEATLSDRVRLVHRLGELPPDQLWCHQLALFFDATTPKPTADSANRNANEIWIGPMKLTKVDALGSDASGPMQVEPFVRLEAPNIETNLQCKRIEAKLARNELNIWGRLTSESPSTVVRLLRMGYEMLAPSIQYVASTNLKQLGTLLASGPGEIRTPVNAEFGLWHAHWDEVLSLVPDQQMHKISLLGRASVESPEQGHLAGNNIECWLGQRPPKTSSLANTTGTVTSNITIEQAHAIGNVKLAARSRNLLVNVEELWLHMLYPDLTQDNSTSAPKTGLQLDGFFGPAAPPPVRQPQVQPQVQSPSPLGQSPLNQGLSAQLPPDQIPPQSTFVGTLPPTTGLLQASELQARSETISSATNVQPNFPTPSITTNPVLLSPVGTAQQFFVATSAADPHSSASGLAPVQVPSTNKSEQLNSAIISVSGRSLNSKVVAYNNQTWIDDLTIDGPLTISRTQAEFGPQHSWEIRGSQLRTATNAAGQADLQIVGQPAVVAMGQGGLAGNVIRLDQKLGLIWMDQPGFFSLPPEVLQTPAASSGLEWLKPLACQWEGRMLFDGKAARIEGKVHLTGQMRTENRRQLLVDGNCHALEIHLNQSIDLNKPEANRAGLEAVVLRDNVIISVSQLDEQERLYSRERISVPKLAYEYATNRLVADGPGWIRSRHPARSGPGQLASTETAQLQGLHMKFRDTLDANLNTYAIAVKGQVRLVVGPINSLEDDLDMDQLRFLSAGQMELSSDLMQAYDLSTLNTMRSLMPSSGIPWEFKANGNVVFEHVSDKASTSGTAHELTYTQPKDLLVIKSDGQSPALLKRIPAAQTNEKQLELNVYVRSATVNLRTMHVDAETVGIEVPLSPTGRENQPIGQPSQAPASIPNPRDLNPFFRPRPQ